jgi:archaeal type IV pilus assembly protein PilA
MAFTKNDEAVSPVIGVILMVAITVILAAVIAAFVFGMAGNVQKTKVVQLTATKNATGYITVTNMGGSDIATLQSVNVSVAGVDKLWTAANNGPISIGSTGIVADSIVTTAQRVILIGHFSDGAQQILLDVTI